VESLGLLATASATTTVAAEPAETYSAVLGLAARLWSVTSDDVVHAAAPGAVVHAVTVDGQTVCWLSWELQPAGPGRTTVRVTHSEADLRPGPEPELDAVLCALRTAVDGSPAAANRG